MYRLTIAPPVDQVLIASESQLKIFSVSTYNLINARTYFERQVLACVFGPSQ